MNLEKLIARYKDYRLDILAFNFASYLINWDSDTEAKAGSFDDRSVLESRLTKLELKITRSKGYINTVTELYNNRELLDEDLKIEIKKVYKDLVKSLKVPKEELIAYTKVLSKASQIWSEAKLNNDYASFAPTLKQIVDFNIRYSKYLETDKLKGYDVLLNEFEEGMTKEKYDEFFSLLKQEIVPLVKKINALKIKKPEWANQEFDINKQKEFCDYLMDVMCFDKNYGLMKESEHPFTSGFGTHDVRVTNHYYSNLLISSIFSAIHELGHATYERGNAEKLNFTFLQGGTTMAMHESQSRFYENIVARTKEFWARHYPKLQLLFFDQLKDVTLDDEKNVTSKAYISCLFYNLENIPSTVSTVKGIRELEQDGVTYSNTDTQFKAEYDSGYDESNLIKLAPEAEKTISIYLFGVQEIDSAKNDDFLYELNSNNEKVLKDYLFSLTILSVPVGDVEVSEVSNQNNDNVEP